MKQQDDLNKRCFPPVVDTDTRLLILGSLPGDASLAKQQYYAHPQNRFWHLLGDVLNVNLLEINYQQRLKTLLKHHIGLWDVVAQAKREGSLDSNITERDDNDLHALLDTLPNLKAIAFNGGTANKIGLKILGHRASAFQIYALPSSSPAYTLPYAEKLQQWQILSSINDKTL
ncbi:MAG: DNA-deoxyinosine glycosylase [Burkholderiaceae bacterium]|nr:MAG: DNA-deoxyinosine glycosylase [Burkholderiaceae bacterium]